MKKVITYGTFDMFHHGHKLLLERARTLGDYLIVGVTADCFDFSRGKINVSQSLSERIESVRRSGLADEIIVEEYEGQKIDDILRHGISVFTVGDDWEGKFDYLNDYCKVIYLPRTKGISSSEIRTEKNHVRLGLIGTYSQIKKVLVESQYVNGLEVTCIYCPKYDSINTDNIRGILCTTDLQVMMDNVDAVYLYSSPNQHFEIIQHCIDSDKHVLCESPICLTTKDYFLLSSNALEKGLILMDGLKTAYSLAFNRLVLLVKSGIIGKIISIDSVCTSLADNIYPHQESLNRKWNSICAWGPTAMLPIFEILGTNFKKKEIISHLIDEKLAFDSFSQISFIFHDAVASIKVGKGVKSEGELIISGTKGYIIVPAPWWKTDYFEVRYENPSENKRYFYQLDGEGIRYELVTFLKSISSGQIRSYVTPDISLSIIKIIEDFYNKTDFVEI